MDTPGLRQFRAVMEGKKQTWLAGLLGIKQPSISAWLAGKSRPEWHHRIALRRLFGIEETAWFTEDELRAYEAASSLPPTGTDGH